MPFCPSCRFEYREGMTRCPECGVTLVPELPPHLAEQLPPAPDTELVELCRLSDPNEGEVVESLLRESGIACFVRTYGPITADLARVVDGATSDRAVVYVTRNRLGEARQVLASLRNLPFVWPEGMEPVEEEDDEEEDEDSGRFLSNRS